MKRSPDYLAQRLETCRKLFFQYNGREHARIEREMRANGFPDFNRRCLYARGVNSGWIEKFRWDLELQRGAAETQGPEPTGSKPLTTKPHESTQSSPADWIAGVPACNAGSSGVARTNRRRRSTNRPLNEFHRWIKKVSPAMFDWDAKHLRLLIKTLQLVTEGKIKRLMIFMPPRHGKSELVTIRYTAWRLLKDPSLKVILASYAQSLANRFSRNIRNTLAEHFSIVNDFMKLRGGEDADTQENKMQKPARSKGDTSDSQDSLDSRLSNPFRSQIINSAQEWETGKGGGVKAVGVGGGITGFGAGLMMIDDPIKSREQAESQAYRDKVWHWFNDDMMTRLEPDAPVILIQTRLHEDDLAGRLLKQQQEDGTNEWHVISLPAIAESTIQDEERTTDNEETLKPEPKIMPARQLAFTTMPPYIEGKSYGDIIRERKEAKEAAALAEAQKDLPAEKKEDIDRDCDPLGRGPGEALWPDRFNIEHLERTKKRMGTYAFESLYQQKPVPTEGGLFKRSWFTNNIVQVPPPNLNWKRGYDLSFTANPESDPSATLKVAYDKDGVLYIDGCFTGRLTYPLQRKMLMHYIKTETRTEHGIELSANGHALLQDLRRMPELYGRKFRGVKVDSSKLTRALPWIALAEEGRVRLVAGRWNEDFIQEACSFPHGHHDDQIDAVSIAVAMHGNNSRKGFWRF